MLKKKKKKKNVSPLLHDGKPGHHKKWSGKICFCTERA